MVLLNLSLTNSKGNLMTARNVFILLVVLAFASAFALAQEQAMEAAVSIEDAKLGRDVVDRQIVDETSMFSLNDRVYLWMRVVGGSKDSISVSWKTGDQSYDTKLYIGGSPWRTWAYKTAYTAGDWTVTVSDDAGIMLKEMSFTVSEATPEQ